ncbi:MAG: hypothetical protein FWH37_03975 [Candidatus Bathyarchaeota archaeon]|nr:hypothetical protein [Candidatus Termiticorpusculum sp.]
MAVITNKKTYVNNRAFVDVTGVIVNTSNKQQIKFNGNSLIDTGFDQGIFLPNKYLKDLTDLGVIPLQRPLRLQMAVVVLRFHVLEFYIKLKIVV